MHFSLQEFDISEMKKSIWCHMRLVDGSWWSWKEQPPPWRNYNFSFSKQASSFDEMHSFQFLLSFLFCPTWRKEQKILVHGLSNLRKIKQEQSSLKKIACLYFWLAPIVGLFTLLTIVISSIFFICRRSNKTIQKIKGWFFGSLRPFRYRAAY